MIWLIVLLGISIVAQWWFIVQLVDGQGDLQGQITALINAHNWNVKELEHRSEQTQVIKVTEL